MFGLLLILITVIHFFEVLVVVAGLDERETTKLDCIFDLVIPGKVLLRGLLKFYDYIVDNFNALK
jgi:hypothetical protein